ncbi:MAG: hypothetical protein ACJA08_001151 [Cyclobacteriaceae bacterium]|jgi:uncharacterized protein YbbC (DUF1343 family)
MKHKFLLLFVSTLFACAAQNQEELPIIPGAYQMDKYLPFLENKNVGLCLNHSSLVYNTHLTDTLIELGIKVKKVFSPEHGYNGRKSDGEEIGNQQNEQSFELISLYGKSKKPLPEYFEDIDVLIFDIQDVGVRFYTYASTMTYLMEACATKGIPFIILDRPNPNGGYVDGPVLNQEFKSFIGLHPIPLVHGLTLGELAKMINGEKWLESGLTCDLKIIEVANWNHSIPYALPVKPSPNLPNELAISLYPSLALFEGTVVSVGRGTDFPFQIYGHPDFPISDFSFTPVPNEGSKNPPLQDQQCNGINLVDNPIEYSFTLKYLIATYNLMKENSDKPFFNSYFTKLTGTYEFQKQIEEGWSEAQIKESWTGDLESYKKIREKYLLYP